MIPARLFILWVLSVPIPLCGLRTACADGRWEAETERSRGVMVVTFDLRSNGTALAGTVGDVMGETDAEEGSVIDEVVSLV